VLKVEKKRKRQEWSSTYFVSLICTGVCAIMVFCVGVGDHARASALAVLQVQSGSARVVWAVELRALSHGAVARWHHCSKKEESEQDPKEEWRSHAAEKL
jgi:hypothetical protein